ncbi:MAG TPA: hypothetical protein VFE62_23925 [Gemmataceae bacterium]|nr:hypothetical protein [Gemmataceae bacterium]
MKRIGLLTTLLALLFVVLPTLTAQDAKKDKADKKAAADDAKVDKKPAGEDTKDPDDKKKTKKEEPKKEKLAYGSKFVTKILSANGANNREFTIEMKEVDPQKVSSVQTWQFQRTQQLAQQLANVNNQFLQANRQTNLAQRMNSLRSAAQAQANYQRDLYNFQIELAKKDIYSTKPYEVRAADDAKVRSLNPPVEFDDQGFQKKWTKKELEERKDKTGLPGFPVDFDQIKSGQYVEIYMVKPAPMPKGKAKNKKANPDDDPPPEAMGRPEFIMIVILRDPTAPK